MARGPNTQAAAKVLVSSMIGALIVYFVGDAVPFDSTTQSIVDVAPMVLVALGLYGAFQKM